MAELLHECWADDTGEMFGAVNEHNDAVRPKMMPGAKLLHSFMAPSWFEARRISNEMRGLELDLAGSEVETIYTEQQKAEQDAYLSRRKL